MSKQKTTDDYLQMKDDLWWLIFLGVTAMGIASRLHYITMPYNVVWDETHFGKMAGWYLNRTFFFDVHPPGGKLIISMFGYLAGYNGTFPFRTPGESYEGYDEIIYMRLGCALFGSTLVPLSFLIVWELTQSLSASAFSGLFCCYEIGLITLSKFILLDPLLLSFIMMSFHALCMFHREHHLNPWSSHWWGSLCYTGLSLGATMSVKFVGVFIVLVVGLYTMSDLWAIYSDVTKSLRETFKHFMTRVFCLILIPAGVYVALFFIHDSVLIYATTSVNFMDDLGLATYSSAFQKRLINSSLNNIEQPPEVSYGSIVEIRNDELGGGYLHSHNLTYPEIYVKGKLQQVTTLKAKDFNNYFRFLFPMDDPDMSDGYYFGEPESILDQNWVRLYHIPTNATVACSRNKSIRASKMNLVYAKPYNLTFPQYPAKNEGDVDTVLEDIWKIKIENGEENDPIKTLETRFQLINPKFKCGLAWSKEKLPVAWGYNQGEAACTKNLQDPYTFWKVERIYNPHADNSTFDNITISFFERLIESHRVMTFMNARLVSQDDGGDRPWMWPILYKASPWYDVQYRIVLLGNPFLFFLNFISLLVTPILIFSYHFKRCRNSKLNEQVKYISDGETMTDTQFMFAIRWLYIAYMLHYIPFFTMQRILYFHHYFPSQGFACMLTAILMTEMFSKFSSYFPKPKRIVVYRGFLVGAALLSTLSFVLYCYVGYGHPTTGQFSLHNSTFKKIRFNDDWHI